MLTQLKDPLTDASSSLSFSSMSSLSGALLGLLDQGSLDQLSNRASSLAPLVIPDPGNNLGTAYNLGAINTTPITINDSVSSSDTIDYYRFTLGANNNFNLSLTGLSTTSPNDADVRLIRDINNNGIVDSGEVIASSTRGVGLEESINLSSLSAGTYFAQVYQYSGSTNYTLRLSNSNSSNLLLNENDLGTLSSTPMTYTDWVGNTDTSDLYRFNLGVNSNFNLSLTGLSTTSPNDADVRLIRDANNNGIVDSGEVIASSTRDVGLEESINLSSLSAGTYFAQVYQYSGSTNYTLRLSATPNSPSFTSFNVLDASGDNTSSTVFQGGAIRLDYSLTNTASLSNVRLEALRNGSVVTTLGTWSGASLSDNLVNLANFSSLTGGDYQLRAVAHTTSNQDVFSATQSLRVLSWSRTNGTFAADTLNYSAGLGTGAIFLGRGGTDTLNLSNVYRSNVTSINGLSLTAFNPLSGSTANQAIFGGTSFDYLTLADGREIYFQGIENLRFIDGTLDLQVHPNDSFFGQQWNLHISDVDSAWRFTQGASNVLLASLDTGILTAPGANGGIVDISMSRLITDPTDDDNFKDYGHGHSAISVMASTANSASGIAGINWNSNVYVNDVYGGVSLQRAISDTIAYARARNMRVVFQGGIQGESWLNSGGTRAQLEQLIQANSDIAVFAVAAGNGNIDIDNTNASNPSVRDGLSGGVARLQTNYSNVIAVGALQRTGTTTVNGLTNASAVDRASYSNYGSSLTLMAATDSPAMDKLGNMRIFGGTSCANPNMAGIASLVWSVNSSLNGGQLRQILIDTAMDLGAAGRDNMFGNGLVNADAAVRRAVALGRNSDLANLYSGSSLFV